jgi:Flp pilus assembly protein TadG
VTLLLVHRARPSVASPRGQSLVEFAIAFPVLMLLIGAIVQFGIIFWGQNTLTQVARDTGRWASTQNGCSTGSVDVVTQAKNIAAVSSLVGTSSTWTAANVNVVWSGGTWVPPATPPPPPTPCPPTSNQVVAFVTITITHQVPIFFPWIPGNGTLTTVAQFRMEPHP